MWYVYILLCSKDRYYTGIAKDVEKRFKDHKRGRAKFTSYNPPIEIVYTERKRTRSGALKRECEIKRMTKENKRMLVASYKRQ